MYREYDTDPFETITPVRLTNLKRLEGVWISLILTDGLVYEGTVAQETIYGIYIHIGGDSNRLSLFPWHMVSKVVYKLEV
jgi:hypothetical protein